MKQVRTSQADKEVTQLLDTLNAMHWPELTRLCRQVLRKNRKHLVAHRLLGFSLHKQHLKDEALNAFAQAEKLFPKDGELLINYASTLIDYALHELALPIFERVCATMPDTAIAWIKLSNCCYQIGLHEKGMGAANIASAFATNDAERTSALMLQAIHRRELGEIHQAVLDCEAAIALAPTEAGAHTNRILFMLGDPSTDATQLTDAARTFGTIFETPLRPTWPSFAAQRHGPWRKLKVGFISPDFRIHAVMYFVEGLLAQLDRRQFEVSALFTYPKEDLVTQRVKNHADHFIHLSGLSIEEQVAIIRSHGYDILIDLAGHTGHNALIAMAHKLAPLQVSWLGFPATTGLEAIDYRFTDDITDPIGAESQYTEQLYRLPSLYACYRPMSRNPLWRYQPHYSVKPLPALTNGWITFGSCNNLGKLTDEVLTLWGRILQTIPDARLLIEGKNLDGYEFEKNYRARCASLGIDLERLILVPLSNDNQYLTYHRIDIALDPFPLTGGTTSFDLLWMGVPLVSMNGDSYKSRMGTSLLSYLGRTEWLAHSAEEYHSIAVHLASDVAALATLRQGLRTEVENSVLMREDLYCQHFGDALRSIWLRWLAKQEAPNDTEVQMRVMEKWLAAMPPEWNAAPKLGVGLKPGVRVSLSEAYQALEQALAKAKASSTSEMVADGQIKSDDWRTATELAETVLSAVPHDPVALSCLAEIEIAHGHEAFAMEYMRYAAQAIAHQSAGT